MPNNKLKQTLFIAPTSQRCNEIKKEYATTYKFIKTLTLSQLQSEIFEIYDDKIEVEVKVKTTYKTGIEMEALTGVSVALLTIWDMVKAIDKDENGQYPETEIYGIKVVEKIKNK